MWTLLETVMNFGFYDGWEMFYQLREYQPLKNDAAKGVL